jgi:hypothetical protein
MTARNPPRRENDFLTEKSREGNMKKNICKGDHPCHLCMLASKDLFEEIKKLTKNPKHICFNCGRVADSSKNLCNPMPLD